MDVDRVYSTECVFEKIDLQDDVKLGIYQALPATDSRTYGYASLNRRINYTNFILQSYTGNYGNYNPSYVSLANIVSLQLSNSLGETIPVPKDTPSFERVKFYNNTFYFYSLPKTITLNCYVANNQNDGITYSDLRNAEYRQVEFKLGNCKFYGRNSSSWRSFQGFCQHSDYSQYNGEIDTNQIVFDNLHSSAYVENTKQFTMETICNVSIPNVPNDLVNYLYANVVSYISTEKVFLGYFSLDNNGNPDPSEVSSETAQLNRGFGTAWYATLALLYPTSTQRSNFISSLNNS